jgi:hypothetical protein
MGTPRLMTCGMVFFTILKSRRTQKLNYSKQKCRENYSLRDAIDDGAHGDAHGASGAVVSDVGNVGVGVEADGLVARVVARHVALAAIDAHVLDCYHFYLNEHKISD